MSAAPDNLLLRARMRDGAIAAAEILSPRVDPAPIFVGLSPAEAAALARRLFSLCPAAQSLAAQAAGEAALAIEIGAEQRRIRALRLLCERLGEMLRASVLDWPRDEAPAPDDLSRLRDALKLLRELPQKNAPPELIASLRAATGGLGLGDARDENSCFARQIAQARDDEANWALPAREPDYLSAADDAAISEAMICSVPFSRAPALPGRCPETGAAARQNARDGGLSARLAARFADMAATIDLIRAVLAGAKPPETQISTKCVGMGGAVAAVDSARGRLYHGLRIDAAGRIADYRIVAPTEWNFHPDGPFARALLGAKFAPGDDARRRIERLALTFDPCVRATAEIVDEGHA